MKIRRPGNEIAPIRMEADLPPIEIGMYKLIYRQFEADNVQKEIEEEIEEMNRKQKDLLLEDGKKEERNKINHSNDKTKSPPKNKKMSQRANQQEEATDTSSSEPGSSSSSSSSEEEEEIVERKKKKILNSTPIPQSNMEQIKNKWFVPKTPVNPITKVSHKNCPAKGTKILPGQV